MNMGSIITLSNQVEISGICNDKGFRITLNQKKYYSSYWQEKKSFKKCDKVIGITKCDLVGAIFSCYCRSVTG